LEITWAESGRDWSIRPSIVALACCRSGDATGTTSRRGTVDTHSCASARGASVDFTLWLTDACRAAMLAS